MIIPVAGGVCVSNQNTHFYKLLLLVNGLFYTVCLNCFLDFKSKRRGLTVDNFKARFIACFFPSECLKILDCCVFPCKCSFTLVTRGSYHKPPPSIFKHSEGNKACDKSCFEVIDSDTSPFRPKIK